MVDVDGAKWQLYKQRAKMVNARQLTEHYEIPWKGGFILGEIGDYHVKYGDGTEEVILKDEFEDKYQLEIQMEDQEYG